MPESKGPARLEVRHHDGSRLVLEIAGDWLAQPGLPGLESIVSERGASGSKSMEFNTAGLGSWNSGLLVFLSKCHAFCRQHNLLFHAQTLPPGIQKLLRLSQAVPENKDARREDTDAPFLEQVGQTTLAGAAGAQAALTFLGETVLAFFQLLRRQAQFRWSDMFLVMQECGPDALGIVALINFLVGLILAFVGALQLTQFGATVYVADLVAIGTVREMGCIMTAIIICGRTGAAFAAQLGTMKVNEEIDAFKSFGISPIEFLVLPRVLALLAMMPLLCVFADLIGILGGFLVSISMLDITATEYVNRTVEAITLNSFLLGIFKGGVFGAIVALTGCLRGVQCGPTAAAVGQATTSAVVAGITAIIAADGIFAVISNALHI